MNRNLIRLFIGGALAIPVAGGLFFIMQYLIASADLKLDDSKQHKLADIHMPEREIDTNVAEPKPDKCRGEKFPNRKESRSRLPSMKL